MEIVGHLFGIEIEYQVVQISQDMAMLTVDGDEVMRFSSASAGGFRNAEHLMDEAADVIYLMEGDQIV